MTIRRRTGLILAGIACALLVVLVLLIPILLNADRYRQEVISYLEEKTGKKVEMGRLGVTFLPRLAIQVDDFGVKSPPLFPPSYRTSRRARGWRFGGRGSALSPAKARSWPQG
jgi:hypothetical protein